MWFLQKKFWIIFLIGAMSFYVGFSQFAVAEEDDDDRYEQEDEEYDEDDDEKSSETVTETIKLPDRYVTKTIIENIIKKDSDRDGLLDENDPHPQIAEIYIVSDQNGNGIDDKYDLE
ncbi:MAG: hypothetical protein ACD_15C00018G0004 [uncultured bacterium]|nr:MAG: hypothetical protein ACD_15C00018G0004 [uncultured bacterium]